MFRKVLLSLVVLLSVFLSLSCEGLQQQYYEVHLIEGDTPFYYVNPDEGSEPHGQNQFANEGTLWVYLYIPVDDVPFSYEHFYAPLTDLSVYREIATDRLFVEKTSEIDDRIYQFYLDKAAFENPA